MNEKIYKLMKGSGAMAITNGIIIMVAGLTCGILMIVTGARLLAAKSDTLF